MQINNFLELSAASLNLYEEIQLRNYIQAVGVLRTFQAETNQNW